MREYEKMAAIAEALDMDIKTVRGRVAEMRDHIGEGKRYPQNVLLTDGRIVRVNTNAFFDYCNHRRELKRTAQEEAS